MENSVFALAQRHSVALGRGSGSEVFAYLEDATELREPLFAWGRILFGAFQPFWVVQSGQRGHREPKACLAPPPHAVGLRVFRV